MENKMDIIYEAYLNNINEGLVIGKTYKVTSSFNAENQRIPNDYDFEPGSEVTVIKVVKNVVLFKDRMGDKWAADLIEFTKSVK